MFPGNPYLTRSFRKIEDIMVERERMNNFFDFILYFMNISVPTTFTEGLFPT